MRVSIKSGFLARYSTVGYLDPTALFNKLLKIETMSLLVYIKQALIILYQKLLQNQI